MKSIETSGKTVEAAVKNGLRELGCDSSDVNIDIVDMGSPGLFGMFGKLAKVRLTLKEKDDDFKIGMPIFSLDEQKPAKSAQKPAQDAPKAQKPAQDAPKAQKPAQDAPKAQKPAQDAPKAAKPAQDAPKAAKPAQNAPKAQKPAQDAPKAAKPAQDAPKPAANRRSADASTDTEDAPRAPRRERPPRRRTPGPRVDDRSSADVEPIQLNEPAPEAPFEADDPATYSDEAKIAVEFLQTTTRMMGVDVQIALCQSAETLSVRMTGDALGVLIGRRGETLDALQYLTSLQVNKNRDEYLRVSLDSENYRQKREDALRKLAGRMAQRARKTGRRVTLEPMNPYERRILHSALQGNPYVETHSEGEEPYRRVIITLK